MLLYFHGRRRSVPEKNSSLSSRESKGFGSTDQLLVYLLDRNSYSAETVRIDLFDNYEVDTVYNNYVTGDDDVQVQRYTDETCPICHL